MASSAAPPDGLHAPPLPSEPRAGDVVRRHRLSTRIWHWVNALTLLVMLMSGLMIFNAHPRLYWGSYGANFDPAWFEIGSARGHGFLRLGSFSIDTSGVLGLWTDPAGQVQERAFPWWATIPSTYSLAEARMWHLAFAWLLAVGLLLYMGWSLINGHIRRDLAIRAAEVRPAALWHDLAMHARLRFPAGTEALRYNILQKLSYVGVIFVLLPLVIVSGLTLSPGMNAAAPWLLDLLGGRQSARSLHFIAMAALAGFFLIHVLMVLLAGPANELRSIITGRYRLPGPRERASGQ